MKPPMLQSVTKSPTMGQTELSPLFAQLVAAIGKPPRYGWQTVELNEPDGPVLFKDKAGKTVGWCSRECWDAIEKASGQP